MDHIKSYFNIAWRAIIRNKVNSTLHIAGLSIGIACAVLIMLYVQDELRYDAFLGNAGHLFQVNMTGIDNGAEVNTGNTAPAVGPALVNAYPEIEACARIYRPGDVMVRYEEGEKTGNYFTERQVWAVDSNFLQVFDYPLLQGDAATCLQKPDAVVITSQTAKKYFGNDHPIGKTLLFDVAKKPFIVTGVLKDIASQSSFQFDMLAPISAYGEVKKRSWNWFWLQVTTYVKLRNSANVSKAAIARLEAKFPALVKEHAFARQGQTFEEFSRKGGKLSYHLMPFTSVHLYANRSGTQARLTTLGDIKYVYVFSIIAVFIIILACVNFTNLSTAQAAKRAKEVGIRKVLGSAKLQLIKQFLAESMLYSFISLLFALLLIFLLLSPFNIIAGKDLLFGSISSIDVWPALLGLCLLTGLLAGIYPAFYLTSFNPVTVLKGIKLFKTGNSNVFIRNGLVVFQFAVSITLIICTAVVFRQLKYMQEKDLGLTKENVVVIANTKRLGTGEEAFRQELLKQQGVLAATISSSIPTKNNFGDTYVPQATEADKPLTKEVDLSSFVVDHDFIPALNMQVLQGRNFSRQFNDSASVILNETAAKLVGWKEAVGKYLEYPGNSQRFKVIAVVKDFNVSSLHDAVEPFALFHASSKTYDLGTSYVSVRLSGGNPNDYLHRLETVWKSFAPATPFDHSFLDNNFEALYRSEQRTGKVFGVFTFLSIFIACLGLFGLSAYMAARRTKEIGVRKVLGATVPGIVLLLSKDFLKLVLLSAFLAFPIAWWAVHQWLEDFAYRIPIGPAVFLFAGSAVLFIALITVSFQSIKAAIANPVKSLRTE